MGSDEGEQERGDELREDVPGDALPLRLREAGQEGAPRHGQGEEALLQVKHDTRILF